MNSGELSARAGVTVRALRHYHQVGVLAEPQRSHNGYRQYGVHDLIRVLRIKRLAALGISLERMSAILDDPGVGSASELDRLENEIDAEIARLSTQKILIAAIREADGALDVPPELGPFLAASAAAGLSPEMVHIDREQSVLLAHVVGEDGMPELARLYSELSDPLVLRRLGGLYNRFEECGPHSSAEDLEALVNDFIDVLAPVTNRMDSVGQVIDLTGYVGLFDDYTVGRLNHEQQRVMTALARRLDS